LFARSTVNSSLAQPGTLNGPGSNAALNAITTGPFVTPASDPTDPYLHADIAIEERRSR
jgi:hypothetical protein